MISAAPDGYAIESNQLYLNTGTLIRNYQDIASGDYITCIAAGPPGGGKTFLAETWLPSKGRKFVRVKANANHLPEFIAEHRHKKFILFADECDYIFDSAPLMNLLKLCLNPYGSRILKDDNKKINCEVHCSIVLATNKPIFEHGLRMFDKKLHDAINGLRSRFQLKSPMSFADPDAYHYACWLATDGAHLLQNFQANGRHLTVKAQNEVLSWWSDNYRTLDELSPRRLLTIAEHRLKAPDVWTTRSETNLTHPRRDGEAMPVWNVKIEPRKTQLLVA